MREKPLKDFAIKNVPTILADLAKATWQQWQRRWRTWQIELQKYRSVLSVRLRLWCCEVFAKSSLFFTNNFKISGKFARYHRHGVNNHYQYLALQTDGFSNWFFLWRRFSDFSSQGRLSSAAGWFFDLFFLFASWGECCCTCAWYAWLRVPSYIKSMNRASLETTFKSKLVERRALCKKDVKTTFLNSFQPLFRKGVVQILVLFYTRLRTQFQQKERAPKLQLGQ